MDCSSADRIYARYLIETAFPLAQAAEVMAGEQSSGTFVRVPGETDELREKHGARVESIQELDSTSVPSLPGAGLPKGSTGPPVYRRAEVWLSWPLANLGPSLPNLLATVAGNLFELKPFSGLRLLDVKLPEAFLDAYLGPQFGVEGTRRHAGVERLPLVGTASACPPRPPQSWCGAWSKQGSTSSRTTSCKATAPTVRSSSVWRR
jgi:ribulose-bisphosphate carboxylase large chain